MKTKSKPSPATAKRAAYPQVTTRHHSQGKLSYQIQSLKDADDGWMAKFKRQGIKAPRLLVMNDSPSGDRLTSLVIHLGIRSEKRIYVAVRLPAKAPICSAGPTAAEWTPPPNRLTAHPSSWTPKSLTAN